MSSRVIRHEFIRSHSAQGPHEECLTALEGYRVSEYPADPELHYLDPEECQYCRLSWHPGEHPPEDCVVHLRDLLDEWYRANCIDISPADGIGIACEDIESTRLVLVASGYPYGAPSEATP